MTKGVGNLNQLAITIEFPCMEGTANILPFHLAPMTELRSQMRTKSVQDLFAFLR